MKKMIGKEVQHKAFGKGVVTSVDGGYIFVKFSAKEAKFAFPSVFGTGFLTIGDVSLKEEIDLLLQEEKAQKEARIEEEKAKRIDKDRSEIYHLDTIQRGMSFSTHAEALNECMGTSYKHYQKAYKLFPEYGIAVWFPSIAKKVMGESVIADTSEGWLNTLAENGAVMYEKNVVDDERNKGERDNCDRLVFAKFDGEAGYNFIGVYRKVNYSEENGFKYERIGTKYDLNKMEVIE